MMIPECRNKFTDVIAANGLDWPITRFIRNYFDEVPLYSQYSEIEFLEEYGDVNELLIYGSLKYLHYVQEVICHDKPNRFAAITISDDDGDYIVPYIFVCNGYFSSRLCKINLSLPQSDLGTKIWKIVNDYPELGNCCANEYDVDGESKIMLTRGAVPGFLLNHI